MATSTIWLYGSKKPYKLHNFKLQQERNMQIDDLETYLTDFQLARFDNVQYFKRELKKDIKLNMPQEALAEDYDVKYQYMKVQNSDSTKPLYYYVQNYSWVSKSTIRFTIYLDTINTFSSMFDFSQKTKIYREHKDRFYKTYPSNTKHLNVPKSAWTDKNMGGSIVYKTAKMTLYEPDYKQYKAGEWNISVSNLSPAWLTITAAEAEDYGYYTIELTNKTRNPLPDDTDFDVNFTTNLTKLIRKIDFQSEGIQAPLYKKKESDIVPYGKEKLNSNWYLIYNTNADSKSIDTYLINDNYFSNNEIFINKENAIIKFSDLVTPKNRQSYYELRNYNNHYSTYEGAIISESNSRIYGSEYSHLGLYYFDGNWRIMSYEISRTDGEMRNIRDILIFETTDNQFFANDNICLQYKEYDTFLNRYYLKEHYDYNLDTITSPLNNFSQVDRTLSTLVKIINTPYCPIPYNITDKGNPIFSSDYVSFQKVNIGKNKSEINVLKLNDISLKLISNINDITNLITSELYKDIDTSTEDRNDDNESKLLHSDFTSIKLAYDSFVYSIDLEKINPNSIENINLQFYTTNTINSRFLFKINGISQLNKTTEIYDGILPVTRNNEMSIYSNDYLNYLRNGYNYDVKNKNAKIAGQWIGAAVSTAAAIAGTVGSFGSAGAFLIPAAIGQLSSAITSTVSAENNFEKKLQETKNQASSVSGSDDIDILEAYSNNKAKFCYYLISNRLRKQMADLFYYFGYISNEMKVPVENTRIWFNYIQCSPVFNNTYNWSDDIIKDITYRFEQGLTVYHHRNNTWDFDQVKENYESWLFA